MNSLNNISIFLVTFVFFMFFFRTSGFLTFKSPSPDIGEEIIIPYVEPKVSAAPEAIVPPQTQILHQKEEKKNKTLFFYKPKKFKDAAEDNFKKPIVESINHHFFSSMLGDMVIIMYDNKNKIRGNMKNKVIRLYDPERIGQKETLAVFLHELAHYIDLYHFKKENNYDLSHEFYTISWQTSKLARANHGPKDFVSGYATTNAYEDFSESFLYYILHNEQFLLKTQHSDALKRKYDFLATAVFYDGAFRDTDFSVGDQTAYTRDISKLNFSLNNFLDYLKKSL